MKQASSQSKKGERVALDFCAKTELVEARRWTERLIWRLLNAVGKPSPLVLVANCTDGRDTEIFLQRGARIVSICASEKQLEFARRQVPSGDFCLLNLECLDLPAEEFDAVWCVGLQMTNSNSHQILSELARVLKSGGILAFDWGRETTKTVGDVSDFLSGFVLVERESYPEDLFAGGIEHIMMRKW
ncbi:MAG: class I SAM-dependent methyltransferase [bacterium]